MSYEVVLEQFSGPLDLLLHLIRKQEINIHDIPIATVTEQYLAYLHAMEELSLDIASEFVVMAATLLAIKSRMLLPRPAPAEDGQEGPEADPRAELVRQLLEYQLCKEAAAQLRQRELAQSEVYSRPPLDLRPFMPVQPAPVEGVTMWDLVDAYRKLLLRVPRQNQVAEITGVVISVEDKMNEIMTALRRVRKTTFFHLFQTARSRAEVVSTFLALLELVKLRVLVCTQVLQFGDIEIALIEEAAS